MNRTKNETLMQMARERTLPHAVILEGGQGDGAEAAMEIARALVCAPASPDIIEIFPEKASMGVDVLRKVRFDAYIKPNQSDYKIYIIHHSELMTEGAQNALLKVLEEPPEYVRFILLSRSASDLLPTVRSRAAVFSLGGTGEDEPENIGSVLAALAARDAYGLLCGFAAFEKDKPAQYALLKYLRGLLIQAAGRKLGGRADESAQTLCDAYSAAELTAMADACGRALSRLDSNVGAALNFSALTAEML